jgi:hypothetical protein
MTACDAYNTGINNNFIKISQRQQDNEGQKVKEVNKDDVETDSIVE